MQVQHQISKEVSDHPNRPIIIISHSWGTVTTFLALNGGDAGGIDDELEKNIYRIDPIKLGCMRISEWVTLGSPLGGKLNIENVHIEVKRPDIVDHWTNFYDKDDQVSASSWNLPGADNIKVSGSGYWIDPTGLTAHIGIWTNPKVESHVKVYYRVLSGCECLTEKEAKAKSSGSSNIKCEQKSLDVCGCDSSQKPKYCYNCSENKSNAVCNCNWTGRYIGGDIDPYSWDLKIQQNGDRVSGELSYFNGKIIDFTGNIEPINCTILGTSQFGSAQRFPPGRIDIYYCGDKICVNNKNSEKDVGNYNLRFPRSLKCLARGKCYPEGIHELSDGRWKCSQGKWSKITCPTGQCLSGNKCYSEGIHELSNGNRKCSQGKWSRIACPTGQCLVGDKCYLEGGHKFSDGNWKCSQGKWSKITCPSGQCVVGDKCYPEGGHKFSDGNWKCSQGTWSKITCPTGQCLSGNKCYSEGIHELSNGNWKCSQGKWSRIACPTGQCLVGDKCYLEGGHKFSDGNWKCSQGKWSKITCPSGQCVVGDKCYPEGGHKFSDGNWKCSQGTWSKITCPSGQCVVGDKCYPEGGHKFSDGNWNCSQGFWKKGIVVYGQWLDS